VRSDRELGLERVEDLPGLAVPGRFFEDGVSQSGNERNHLFSHVAGGGGARAFRDVSGVSGLDHPADGRAFAWLDFDRDGWLDVAAVNANGPLLQLFRNELGERPSTRDHGALVVTLRGGARAHPDERGFSNRDGIGARVRVEHADGRVQVRELRGGEGLAAQNAGRLHFGLGSDARVPRVEIDWPSGRRSVATDVEAGALLVVDEREGASKERWIRPAPDLPRARTAPGEPPLAFAIDDAAPQTPSLRVFTSFATWCGICLGELPQVDLLRETFPSELVRLDGIPVDPEDTDAKLASWSRKHRPAYRVRDDWAPARRAQLAAWLADELSSEGLPATVVTDAAGHVLHTQWGVPTVSTLRWLIAGQRDASG